MQYIHIGIVFLLETIHLYAPNVKTKGRKERREREEREKGKCNLAVDGTEQTDKMLAASPR